ncbi:MAG: universal stress protein [Nitriliruptoraceae bacterium]
MPEGVSDTASSLGRSILVPVVNPASIHALLSCAAALARRDGGAVDIVTVLTPGTSDEQQATVQQRLAEAQRTASELGADATAHVEIADDVSTGVLNAMRQTTPSLVLIGWRGETSSTDVCGRLIDRVVGRTRTPIAVLRAGRELPTRGVLPVHADHLLPGGVGGLRLATHVAAGLRADLLQSMGLLATGHQDFTIPDDLVTLCDTLVRDQRRNHLVVAEHATPDTLIISPVAPTAVGFRAATTHLAWSAPRAGLLVTIDPGPPLDVS